MQGDARVIELLNEALKNELTAINQYWLHYRVLDNWGIDKLAEYERQESIDEMKHADRIAERILFFDGLPNFQALGRLRIGENVEEILKADLEAEHEGAVVYRNLVVHCEEVRDFDLLDHQLVISHRFARAHLQPERCGPAAFSIFSSQSPFSAVW